MSSIGDAITYPTERDDWVTTILIGGLLSLFGFLLLPIIPVYGYLVRVIRHRLDDKPEPPTFGDWEELFVDGGRAMLIGIAYFLIPGIVGALTVGGSIAAIATGTRSGAAMGVAGLAMSALISFVFTLIFGYFAVVGLVNFAREDRLGAAFEFDTLRSVAFTEEYAIAWGLSVVVFIGAGIVAGVLGNIPLIGAVASAFVFFYVQIVAADLWAGGYRDARKSGEAAEVTEADETAI